MQSHAVQRLVIIATIVSALSACAAGGGSSPSAPAGPTAGPPGKGHPQVSHVIIIIQENRSVDNLFQGFPGADTQPYGFDRKGIKLRLCPFPSRRHGTLNTMPPAF